MIFSEIAAFFGSDATKPQASNSSSQLTLKKMLPSLKKLVLTELTARMSL